MAYGLGGNASLDCMVLVLESVTSERHPFACTVPKRICSLPIYLPFALEKDARIQAARPGLVPRDLGCGQVYVGLRNPY